jgi:fimbrial isopeptide formation D2 family protein/LPXTG-motif cell wall-anchored protein
VDDLTHVLDDADLQSGPISSDAAVKAVRDGKRLEITGGVGAGTMVTVTYTVTVKAADQVGDSVLANFLLDPDQTVPADPTACAPGDEDCTTNPLPAPQMRVVKKMSAPSDAGPGDVVTYTVTATNTGSVDYSASKPARFSDDFTKVLDDADYAGDAKASSGAVGYDDPTLTWSGPLRTGQTVTVTYSFTIHDPLDGDGRLVNVVVTPDGVNGNCEVGQRDKTCGTVMAVSDRAPDDTDTPRHEPDDNGILPETGGPAWWLLVAGLVGLLGGSVLLAAARKRR